MLEVACGGLWLLCSLALQLKKIKKARSHFPCITTYYLILAAFYS